MVIGNSAGDKWGKGVKSEQPGRENGGWFEGGAGTDAANASGN